MTTPAAGGRDGAAVAGTALPGALATPSWLRPLVDAATSGPWPGLLGTVPPARGGRDSAVLMLLADGDPSDGPDLLLVARAGTLRTHAGQPAFPGGRSEAGETPVQTALREAHEETGVRPDDVTPLVLFAPLELGFSGHLVHPVLAHWHRPGPVDAVDPAETAAVARVPLAALADPAHRGTVRLSSGFAGPAFAVGGLVVWGFTALLVDALLTLGGFAGPWDRSVRLTLPETDAGHRFADGGLRS